ncbi:MAG: hypothetical protein HGJ97_19600 [Desulfosporosinus sp.]|nr:hypothetical protein [Desulfosporosinus sp.]
MPYDANRGRKDCLGRVKKSGDVVHGTERRKLKEPTFGSILKIMDRVGVVTMYRQGN